MGCCFANVHFGVGQGCGAVISLSDLPDSHVNYGPVGAGVDGSVTFHERPGFEMVFYCERTGLVICLLIGWNGLARWGMPEAGRSRWCSGQGLC